MNTAHARQNFGGGQRVWNTAHARRNFNLGGQRLYNTAHARRHFREWGEGRRHNRSGLEKRGPKPDSFPEIPVDHTAHAQQLSGNSRGPHCACATAFRNFPTAFRTLPEIPDSFPTGDWGEVRNDRAALRPTLMRDPGYEAMTSYDDVTSGLEGLKL